MNKYEKNSLEELKNSYCCAGEKLKELETGLYKKKHERIMKFLSLGFSQIKGFNSDIKKLEEEIETKKQELKKQKEYLDSICTFDLHAITSFFSNLISMFERVSYDHESFSLMNYYANDQTIPTRYGPTTLSAPSFHFTKAYVISNNQSIKYLKELSNQEKLNNISDVNSVINSIGYEKSIVFETDNTDFSYNFIGGVPYQIYKNFSYLEEVMTDLINYKIANPNVYERAITTLFLGEVSTDYIESKKQLKRI